MPRDASDLVGESHDWITQETLAQAIVNGDELKLVGINEGRAPLPSEGRD